MAKTSGLSVATLSVDDSAGSVQPIVNDFNSFSFSTPRGVQDVTGVDKAAVERLLLLADFSITLNLIFDPASNFAHDVFKTVPSTSVQRTTTITMSGKTLANEVLYTDYPLQRAATAVWSCYPASRVSANRA